MNYIFRLSYNKIYGVGPRYNVPSPHACLSRAPRAFLRPSIPSVCYAGYGATGFAKKQAIYYRIQLRMERSTCPESYGRGVS